jgi:hypothetical protein
MVGLFDGNLNLIPNVVLLFSYELLCIKYSIF